MSRRRTAASIAANPVLIGGITVLVILVAVFLSYNANQGLPFVPTYDLRAQVPDAANLVHGDDVRMGGARIGVVSSIEPVHHADGRVTAQLDLKLETGVKPLPVDSTVLVRPRSVLGLKYVEITKGDSARGFPAGARIPLANAKPHPVELDQVLSMFDQPTRRAQQTILTEIGDGLAGRGQDLNTTIRDLDPLLRALQPVMANLASPRTDLAGFFQQVGRTAAIVAPAADTQARLFVNLDRTFSALASVARPYIQQAVERGPATLDAGLRTFPVDRPFLDNTRRLFAELAPGVQALRHAAPDLASALAVGTPTLKRSLALNGRLKRTFGAVQDFTTNPITPRGIGDLSDTVSALAPTVHFVTPAQTVCNYVTLWFRNVSSLLSAGDANGTWQRFSIIASTPGPNSEQAPSSAPANGPKGNYLHSNPYPNTAAPGEPHECEAGNEPFLSGRQVIGNVPGNQGVETERTKVAK